MVTSNDKYSIPRFYEILGKLGQANYFSTFDLTKRFYLIEVDQGDK